MRANEFLTESSPRLMLKDFKVTISPHALDRCRIRNINPKKVDAILQNISKVKHDIMGIEPGSSFILHDGHGTGIGLRKGIEKNLILATVYHTGDDFVRGMHPTFLVDIKP